MGGLAVGGENIVPPPPNPEEAANLLRVNRVRTLENNLTRVFEEVERLTLELEGVVALPVDDAIRIARYPALNTSLNESLARLKVINDLLSAYSTLPPVHNGGGLTIGLLPSDKVSNAALTAGSKISSYNDQYNASNTVYNPVDWAEKTLNELTYSKLPLAEWYSALKAKVPVDVGNWMDKDLKGNWEKIVNLETYREFFVEPFLKHELTESYIQQCRNKINNLRMGGMKLRQYNSWVNLLVRTTRSNTADENLITAYIDGLRLDLKSKVRDHDCLFPDKVFKDLNEAQEYALKMDPVDRGDVVLPPFQNLQGPRRDDNFNPQGYQRNNRYQPYVQKAIAIRPPVANHVHHDDRKGNGNSKDCFICSKADPSLKVIWSKEHMRSKHPNHPAVARWNAQGPLPRLNNLEGGAQGYEDDIFNFLQGFEGGELNNFEDATEDLDMDGNEVVKLPSIKEILEGNQCLEGEQFWREMEVQQLNLLPSKDKANWNEQGSEGSSSIFLTDYSTSDSEGASSQSWEIIPHVPFQGSFMEEGNPDSWNFLASLNNRELEVLDYGFFIEEEYPGHPFQAYPFPSSEEFEEEMERAVSVLRREMGDWRGDYLNSMEEVETSGIGYAAPIRNLPLEEGSWEKFHAVHHHEDGEHITYYSIGKDPSVVADPEEVDRFFYQGILIIENLVEGMN